MIRIIVEKGEEYLAKEEIIYKNRIFFSAAYRQAWMGLSEIITASDNLEGSKGKQGGSFRGEDNSAVPQRANNILTFCADRGQGKTTAMVSFARALEFYTEEKELRNRVNWRALGEDLHFVRLKTIDPTGMEGQDSIVKIVISRMFDDFRSKLEGSSCAGGGHDPGKMEERDTLYTLFQKCFHYLDLLSKSSCPEENPYEDELERISELGDSSNLRSYLYRLIQKYLDFMAPQGKKTMLVIPIDDADLNVEKAYTMMEEIRKYLHLPRVILLMAANMRQMEATVEQYYLRQYETSIQADSGSVDVTRCHRIAEQYLEKLFPKPLRVYLPELNLSISSLQEGDLGIQIEYDGLEDGRSGGDGDGWSYQKQLLHLLHQKTGLIFLVPQDHLHDFLPATMRELTHFLAYFSKLKDVTVNYDDIIDCCMGESDRGSSQWPEMRDRIQTWLENIDALETYLEHLWSSLNLQRVEAFYLQQLAALSGESKHRYLLHVLPDLYAWERMTWEKTRGSVPGDAAAYKRLFLAECAKREVYVQDSLDREFDGQPVYASYADVLTALNILEDLPGDAGRFKFTYAVTLHYSLYCHRKLLERVLSPLRGQGHEEGGLTGFFEDVLYRGDVAKDTQKAPIFWRFSVDGDMVRRVFMEENADFPTREDASFLQRYLRLGKEFPLHYKTVPLRIAVNTEQLRWEEADPNVPLVNLRENAPETFLFSPFYSLLYELHLLFEGTSEDADNYTDDEIPATGDRVRMKMAMALFLNTDIQQRLLQRGRQPDRHPYDGLRDAINAIQLTFADILFGAEEADFEAMAGDVSPATAGLPQGERFRIDWLQYCIPSLRDAVVQVWVKMLEGQGEQIHDLSLDILRLQRDIANRQADAGAEENRWRVRESHLSRETLTTLSNLVDIGDLSRRLVRLASGETRTEYETARRRLDRDMARLSELWPQLRSGGGGKAEQLPFSNVRSALGRTARDLRRFRELMERTLGPAPESEAPPQPEEEPAAPDDMMERVNEALAEKLADHVADWMLQQLAARDTPSEETPSEGEENG